MKKSYTLIWLTAIICLGFFLRIYLVQVIPPGLNRDEAAIGYTAYSLLKTGRDEYGQAVPLSLKSFGDWKLPLYAYITVPSVWIFGLTELAVRLPSVILGTLTILLTFLITQKIGKTSFALLTAFLLAVSPWHIFFSRVTSEANVAVFLVTLAVFLFTQAKKYPGLLMLGTFCLSLTLLTYHGNHVFTPLFFFLCLFYFRSDFGTKIGKGAIVLFILISLFVFSKTATTADTTKISGLLAINDPSIIHENIELNRNIFNNSFIAKVLNNKYVFLGEQIASNYLKAFSPEFLVVRGGGNAQHNIPNFGNIYLLEYPFLFLGLYFLFVKKTKWSWFLLFWLLFAPLAPSLTKDAPHSARQFSILPALYMVISYAIYELGSLGRGKFFRVVFFGGFTLLLLANMSLFLSRYFVLFPYKSYAAWGAGYKEMIKKLAVIKNNYSEVYVSKPDYSPYIYYVFYQQSDPKLFQKNVVRYEETDEGFQHVRAFDGINYKKIDWAPELLIPNRLYVDFAEAVPTGATNSGTMITKIEQAQIAKSGELAQVPLGTFVTSRLVDTVNLPNGQPFIYFIETRIGTPAARLAP